MPCPNCKDGVYAVLGENKFKVTVDNSDIKEDILDKKQAIQDIVDKNVKCEICLCFSCFKVFLNTNCDIKKFEKEVKELARQYEEEKELT